MTVQTIKNEKNMKKLYIYLMTALMAVTMASCEDSDAVEARTLDGSWTGYIETYYYDRWGLTGNTYRTTMFFNQRNVYGGTGYEVDYDLNNRYDSYYYCEFDWEVYNGNIIIRYADSSNNVYIYDYQLYSNYFEGYMDDGTRRDIHFELRYDGSFDWSNYRSRYYAPTRSQAEAADSVEKHDRYYACGDFAKNQ